jgi:mycoredoxin
MNGYHWNVIRVRSLLAGLVFAVAATSAASAGRAAQPQVSSLSAGGVTIYGAKWCSACRSLERGLTERKIAFEVVDVDENPAAFAKARAASGAGGAIPLSSVTTSTKTTWIVGADVEAVDRALKD